MITFVRFISVFALALVFCTPHAAVRGLKELDTAREAHTVRNDGIYSFSKIKDFHSLSFLARIVPSGHTGAFDFVVSFGSETQTNYHGVTQEKPKFSFQFTGNSCSEPLDVSLVNVDKKGVYSYQTFFENFSPLTDIELELKRIGKKRGAIIYLATVNGVEKTIKFEKKVNDIRLWTRGARMELTNTKLVAGK